MPAVENLTADGGDDAKDEAVKEIEVKKWRL